MSTEKVFPEVLHQWAEIFLRRSMRDFMNFSKESGLSMSQFSALFRLFKNGSCGVSDLGEHLGVTNAAASQMIERLVQQGLISRTEDPQDRRLKKLELTSAGLELIHASIEARRRWMEDLTKALTPEDQETIIQGLTLLTRAAQALDTQSKLFHGPVENEKL